jgi:hypothetical protein
LASWCGDSLAATGALPSDTSKAVDTSLMVNTISVPAPFCAPTSGSISARLQGNDMRRVSQRSLCADASAATHP